MASTSGKRAPISRAPCSAGDGRHPRLRSSRGPALAAVLLLLLGGACGGGEGDGADSSPSGGNDPERTATKLMADMDLDTKVGQLFVATASGTSPEENADLIARYQPGGLIYFPENLTGTAQIAELSNGLQKHAGETRGKTPLFIGVDQEQGAVARLPVGTRFPDAMAVGATRSREHAATLARTTAAELSALGINLDYAPDADVNVNPDNPVIGTRSFGSDPDLVGRMAVAEAEAFEKGGVVPVAKHFPGHGNTDVDSHTGLPRIDTTREEWEKVDLPPFRKAVDADVDAIMTAHVFMPALDDSGEPSTLSGKVIDETLRKDLGYDGVITTDALNMEGVRQTHGSGEVAVRAVEAGADQLLMPPDLGTAFKAVRSAVEKGRISRDRLDASVRRVLELKVRRGLYDATPVDTADAKETVGDRDHRAAAQQVADASVTLLRNEDGVLPLKKGQDVAVTGSGAKRIATALQDLGPDVTGSASSADVVVVGTDTDTTEPDTGQRKRVSEARSAGKPVVVVAQGAPYDLGELSDVDGYLATYSSVGVSRTAAARALTGKVEPSGTLPVDIPHTDLKRGDGQGY